MTSKKTVVTAAQDKKAAKAAPRKAADKKVAKATEAPVTVEEPTAAEPTETAPEAPVTVEPEAAEPTAPEAAEPTVELDEWDEASAELLGSNPKFAEDLTPDQITFITNKCKAFTAYKDVVAVYGGSGSVNSFARQLCLKVKPELGRRDTAPAPAPLAEGDTLVFCDLCGRSVPASGTHVVAGKRYCQDKEACKAAKGDPKTQTQNILARQAANATTAAAKKDKPVTSGRAWPWPDTHLVIVLNANHGRSGVRADIFGKICVEQTVAELKAKTFEQRGGQHKMPVADVIAAVSKKNVIILDAVAAEAYKAEIVATAANAAKQGHQGEAPKGEPTSPENAEQPEDACIGEAADIQADAIANQ